MTRIAMFALLTVPLLPDPAQSEEPATVIPPRTTWNLKLDRTLDGRLDATDSHLLSLQSANDQLVGTYQDKGPTATGNHSVLTGRFIPGSPPLVSLRQDGALGYTALYTGRLVSEDRMVGSYVDNRGSSGDWSLTRVIESAEQGDQVLEPLGPAVSHLRGSFGAQEGQREAAPVREHRLGCSGVSVAQNRRSARGRGLRLRTSSHRPNETSAVTAAHPPRPASGVTMAG